MRSLGTIAVFLALSVPVHSSPVTYACTVLQGQDEPGMFSDVDQVVIDVEAQSIELRVARTMGTVAPVNWLYYDRDGEGDTEQFIIRDNGNGVIAAAGMNGIGSYSFLKNGKYFLFGVTLLAPTMAFTWECTE